MVSGSYAAGPEAMGSRGTVTAGSQFRLSMQTRTVVVASVVAMPAYLCLAHRRPSRASCSDCGAPVCADCAVEAGGAALCSGCATRDHDLASLRSEGVEARLMLRRAGVRVRRVAGDPLIVRSGGVP